MAKKWEKRFLAALGKKGSMAHACAIARVSRSTVEERRTHDADFALAMQDAFADASDRLLEMIARLAKAGDLKLLMLLMSHYRRELSCR
jgi:hypothetical protein